MVETWHYNGLQAADGRVAADGRRGPADPHGLAAPGHDLRLRGLQQSGGVTAAALALQEEFQVNKNNQPITGPLLRHRPIVCSHGKVDQSQAV